MVLKLRYNDAISIMLAKMFTEDDIILLREQVLAFNERIQEIINIERV